MKRRLFLAIACASLALPLGLVRNSPAKAAGPVFSPPGKYFLVLGDSVAFGYQDAKARAEVAATGTVDPATFASGGTMLGRMLSAIDPGIQTVNYSCPAETSTTFINGGCPYPYPLHNAYSGSQLSAAVAFLQAHPGQVSPITFQIGSNDFLQLLASCKNDFTCAAQGFPAILKTAAANITQIVGALRQAAPSAEIILPNFYDPYAVINPAADTLTEAGNSVVAQVAAAFGGVLVDTFTPFNLAQPQPQTLCTLTLMCSAAPDIHPSDQGQLTVAKLFWNASGYASITHGFMDLWYGPASGTGEVFFGSGPGCLGLVETATRDLQPPGTTHIVYVTGNDLPGTVGDNGIISGGTYFYENVTNTSSGEVIDNNAGSCYSLKASGL